MAKSKSQAAAASPSSSKDGGGEITSGRSIRCIATNEELEKFLKENHGRFAHAAPLNIGIEFFLADACPVHRLQQAPCVVAVAIASESPRHPATVLMVQNLDQHTLVAAFTDLWADERVVKVMHAVQRPAQAWLTRFGCSLMASNAVKTIDLQQLVEHAVDPTSRNATTLRILTIANAKASQRHAILAKYAYMLPSKLSCTTRMLSPQTQQQLVQNAQAFANLYCCLRVLPLPLHAKNANVASSAKWKTIITHVTKATIDQCAPVPKDSTTMKADKLRLPNEESSQLQPAFPSTSQERDNTSYSNSQPHMPILHPHQLPSVSSIELMTCSNDIKCITTDTQLGDFLIENQGRLVTGNPQAVGIDFLLTDICHDHTNSKKSCLAAITIASDSQVYPAVILLVQNLNKTLLVEAFQGLWANIDITKAMIGVRRAAVAWHAHFGSHLVDFDCSVAPTKVIDLQLLVEHTMDTSRRDINVAQMANLARLDPSSQHFAASGFSFVSKAHTHVLTSVESCQITALGPHIQQRLTHNAQLIANIYQGLRMVPLPLNAPNASVMDAGAWRSKLRQVTQMTADRCANAVDNNGIPSIWFDKASDYEPRSLECLVPRSSNDSDEHVTEDDDSLPLHRLELQCEIDSLLAILPRKYREAVMRVEDYRERLVDVCLDVGRVPYVYVGKRKRVPLEINHQSSRSGWDVLINSKSSPDEAAASKLVTKQDIDKMLELLGGETRIGGDNRAGIDAQLHRVAVMRSKTKEIYGVTLRVGRALIHAASALSDLLLSTKHREKSVLLLGHPGCGKTTLIRDIARCISETRENVCIIDTSNEMGGDGLVPHACIGWARRMMVPSLELQASVMVECVQNHTVETMVIDEIGRKAEVSAASTVRQRGPRLVASAHGDFQGLMKNPDLKGLLGGTQQVIMSASEVKEQKLSKKSQTERAGSPVFDVIVELDRETPGLCHIIWDVEKAVDCVLSGKPLPKVESRCWNMSTRGVQVLS